MAKILKKPQSSFFILARNLNSKLSGSPKLGVDMVKFIFWPKSKTSSEVFLESGPFLNIFFGDFIKKWGKVGEVAFFWSGVASNILFISDMEKFSNSKILFLVIQY